MEILLLSMALIPVTLTSCDGKKIEENEKESMQETEKETESANQENREYDGTYGPDITDKNDIISICCSVWFDAILGKSGSGVDSWYNMTEVMEGKAKRGNTPDFHYRAKPGLGYYSSSNVEVDERIHQSIPCRRRMSRPR